MVGGRGGAEAVTKRLLARLRAEKAVNTSAWLRQLVQQALEKEFPDFVDYLADPVKPDPQKTPIESSDDRERAPADQAEAGRLSDVQEPDPQKTPIEGWRPRRLPDGQWGALLEGPGVAGLPDDNQLPGTPIVVTDKRGESWTTTLTEVVDRTDTTITVKTCGRPRS